MLKGYGDPKITIEQWQAFMAELRGAGARARSTGDLVLDRTFFKLPEHDPAAFDHEPLRPYNVGPDALLVNFKAVRFAFAPERRAQRVDVRSSRRCPTVALGALPPLVDGDCGDWRATSRAELHRITARSASAAFPGRYPQACGERDWYVALLDHPHYVHGMFATYFREAGGQFGGGVREGRAPREATPFAVLESPPLYDIVRDINKLSNNVMARQVFLTLATTASSAAGDAREAADVVQAGSGEEARDAGARDRERLGAVAERAHHGRRARAAAGGRRREPGARGVRELARGRGDRRHRAAALPERHASPARRCSRPARSKACARSPATSSTPRAGAGSSSRSSTIRTPRAAPRALD